jgi:phenylacetate-CoA ligase
MGAVASVVDRSQEFADRVYRSSPVVLQNVAATAFGVRARALRYGGRFREFAAELEDAQWWAADRLQTHQDQRVREMVEFCVGHVPYYRDLFAHLGLTADSIRTAAALEQLPVLEKETVRAEADRFVPVGGGERLIASTTGGTTGTPLRFYVTPSAVQFNYAAYETRFRHWAGVRFGQRTASINGRVVVPGDQQAPPFWRHNLAFNQLYLSAYHLSEQNLPAYLAKLGRYRPEVVVGYVSTVHVLARHILERGLVGVVRPQAVLVSSETLFPWLRADIEAAFGCRVTNGYSLGELTAMISECPSGRLHVSPEYGVVELVPADGAAELVTTTLCNRGTPLLRYRTGDVAVPAPGDACPCGRQLPAVGEILGRVDDRVRTPDGRTVGPAPLSLAFQAIAGVRAAQVVQDSVESVTVVVVTAPGWGPDEECRLLAELRDRLGPSLAIGFERVDELTRTAAGKQRLIVSSLRS